jgi:hypothetical protein
LCSSKDLLHACQQGLLVSSSPTPVVNRKPGEREVVVHIRPEIGRGLVPRQQRLSNSPAGAAAGSAGRQQAPKMLRLEAIVMIVAAWRCHC